LKRKRGDTVLETLRMEEKQGGQKMKKLIMIAFALTLALSIVLVPSVAADGPYPITIIKTIPAGGPPEDFTFHAWRDLDMSGDVSPGDFYCGQVVIHGAGEGVIDCPYLGQCIVCEELSGGSAYAPQPCQIGQANCEPVEFVNELGCKLIIEKVDEEGNPLPGPCFQITPDPRTGEGSLHLCDGDANDECDGADGVLCLGGLICGLECTVEETVVPPSCPNCELAPPQTVTISGVVTVTFVNRIPTGDLTILKQDGSGNALAGACFEITPDPKTGMGVMTLCDEGLNDEALGQLGVLAVLGCIDGLTCTVEETVAPPGYDPAPAQTVTISGSVELTFVNTITPPSCGTVCAAQTKPGEFLFSDKQENWFTWIYYNIGDGTAADPYTYPIYTGATTLCGTLYVYDDGTHIFVNYELTDIDGGCTLGGLSEYHLEVDETLTDLKKHVMNKKNPVPGKCEYKGTFDPMQPSTGWIEADNKSDDDISGWDTAYIFAHGIGCYYCP
jgi:hypothetical protein